MGANATFEEIVIEILNDYYSTFNIERVNADYVFTDEVSEKYKELRPDYFVKEPEKLATLDSYNGVMVCPCTHGGVFTIIINKKLMAKYVSESNMTWVGTIVHETTHVRDYTDFANILDARDYDDISNIGKNLPFQLWTEINARARGYYFVRKYTFGNVRDNRQIDDIVKTELPKQEELLFLNYHHTQDGVQQAYYVSHFLGRIYTLSRIFPEYFNEEWIEMYPLFINNKWMKDWLYFFIDNNVLTKASENFEKMKSILRQNFSWI